VICSIMAGMSSGRMASIGKQVMAMSPNRACADWRTGAQSANVRKLGSRRVCTTYV
jgi:hypothetical protein